MLVWAMLACSREEPQVSEEVPGASQGRDPLPVGDSGEDSGEETSAGTTSYARDVDPIVTRSCATSGCHDAEAEEGLDLRSAVALASLVDVPAEQAPLDRVEPGDPAASYFWHKLNGTQSSVGGRGDTMPKDAPPLSAEELALIEAWISEGTLP